MAISVACPCLALQYSLIWSGRCVKRVEALWEDVTMGTLRLKSVIIDVAVRPEQPVYLTVKDTRRTCTRNPLVQTVSQNLQNSPITELSLNLQDINGHWLMTRIFGLRGC